MTTPKLYLVGGTVRDHVLGRTEVTRQTGDLDFAVEADSFGDMERLLHARGFTAWQVRPEFVTVRGRLPASSLGGFGGLLSAGLDSVAADFTLCRKDGHYSDQRHPDSVAVGTLLDDLARRDFTVNAMAVSENGVWYDPAGGRADAFQGRLDTVGDPDERFHEDPLRVLRALRFCVTHGLRPSHAVVDAVGATSAWLKGLPAERVRAELLKAFRGDTWRTLELLHHPFGMLAGDLHDLFPGLWLKPTLEDR